MVFRKLAILLIVAMVLLCGCSVDSSRTDSDSRLSVVQVAVTSDFGRAVLVEESVETEPGTTALDALKMVADIETKYGGRFVQTINGISSEFDRDGRSQMDWFLYINGICSKVGASDYVLRQGDIERWDFRDWSYHQYVPAVIGDFPQPFLGGYAGVVKPTAIICEEWLDEHANSLMQRLSDLGIEEVSRLNFAELPENVQEGWNLILLGSRDNALIAEMNEIHDRLGLYAYFEQDVLVLLDSSGQPAGEYSGSYGLIQATQNPWNPRGTGSAENVVWVVSGTDEAGMTLALETIINRPYDIQHAYAALIAPGAVIKVPQ